MNQFLNVLAILGMTLSLLVIAIVSIPRLINLYKFLNCKRERYFETMACDAVCCHCGVNMGFIGTVRASRDKVEEIGIIDK